MKKQLGVAFAAALMWVAFTVPMLPVLLALLPIMIVLYAITGKVSVRDRVKTIGKALDQLVNATYFSGHPKETISSHAGRWLTEAPERAPKWVFVISWLTNLFEENHCIKAIEAPFVGMPLGGGD